MIGHSFLWKLALVTRQRDSTRHARNYTNGEQHSPAELASFERRCGDGRDQTPLLSAALKYDRRGR